MVFQDMTHYSQVGWFKDYLDQNASAPEHVFSEYNDSTNAYAYVRRYYDVMNGTWGLTKATTPSTSVEYKVTWIDNSGAHRVQNVYMGQTSQNVSVGFSPVYYEVDGEVRTYAPDSGGNHYGDHGPGHIGGHMWAESIQYYSDAAGWTNGLPYSKFYQGPFGFDPNATPTPTTFDIWDSRCSN